MTPEDVVKKTLTKWDNEELNLNQFVLEMQRQGWTKVQIYDWLCNGDMKPPAVVSPKGRGGNWNNYHRLNPNFMQRRR